MTVESHNLLDLNAVRSLLQKSVVDSGSQAAWCIEHKVSTAYLSDVLNGRREPGKKILDILDLESVILYRNKAK